MKRIGILFSSLIALSACVKEDFFGKSSLKQINFFSIQNQSGVTIIIEDSLLIRTTVAANTDLTQLRPDSVAVSSYARVEPSITQIRDFTRPVLYTVIAEDGSRVNYTVVITKEAANPQLENSSFDDWYTPSGKNYQEPGLSSSSIWATGNAGVVTLGNANVTPVVVSGTDNAVQLVTKDLGTLGQLVSQRMAAGSIFTGRFELDIANPLNSTKFGIPFTARPVGFSLSYTYQPGSTYRNNKGVILSKADSCDIYLILENKEGAEAKRIATGWFRSGDAITNFTNINIPLIYGNLPANAPAYSKPINGLYGSANDKITHISFVAASSSSGALFEGGVNSTLQINNLQLKYQ